MPKSPRYDVQPFIEEQDAPVLMYFCLAAAVICSVVFLGNVAFFENRELRKSETTVSSSPLSLSETDSEKNTSTTAVTLPESFAAQLYNLTPVRLKWTQLTNEVPDVSEELIGISSEKLRSIQQEKAQFAQIDALVVCSKEAAIAEILTPSQPWMKGYTGRMLRSEAPSQLLLWQLNTTSAGKVTAVPSPVSCNIPATVNHSTLPGLKGPMEMLFVQKAGRSYIASQTKLRSYRAWSKFVSTNWKTQKAVDNTPTYPGLEVNVNATAAAILKKSESRSELSKAPLLQTAPSSSEALLDIMKPPYAPRKEIVHAPRNDSDNRAELRKQNMPLVLSNETLNKSISAN